MLASISPFGERARGQRWGVTVAAYTVASTVAGAMLGALLGAVGVAARDLSGVSAQLRLIAVVAQTTQTGLFRRFEIMRHWNETQQLAPASLIGPDGLHMTDASYGCLADQLAEALASSWSQEKVAKSIRRNPAALVGIRPAHTQPGVSSGLH